MSSPALPPRIISDTIPSEWFESKAMCVYFSGSLNKWVILSFLHMFYLQMGDVQRDRGVGKRAFLQQGSFELECVIAIIFLVTGF